MAIRKAQPVFAPTPGFLILDSAIRRAISRAITACPCKSRADIAEVLSVETGTQITVRMLDQFTAVSRRPYRFPAAWVIPFCRITGDNTLQRILLGSELSEALELGLVVKDMLMKNLLHEQKRGSTTANQPSSDKDIQR